MKTSLLTVDEIRRSSAGQVKTADIVNRRTLKPVSGGLFASKIFGPIESRVEIDGRTYDLTGSRESFGHIELARPVVHIWYVDRLAALLGRPAADVYALMRTEKIVLPETFELALGVEVEEGTGPTGSAALRALINRLEPGPRALADSLLLGVLPVLPAGLRPLALMESDDQPRQQKLVSGPPKVAEDVNELYRRVLRENDALANYTDKDAPNIIVRNAEMMLQRAVNHLFVNGCDAFTDALERKTICDTRPLKTEDWLPLTSLTTMLQRIRSELAPIDVGAEVVTAPDEVSAAVLRALCVRVR